MLNVKKTKISAFKVSEKLDSGPICLQTNLSLKGSAEDIFKRMETKSILMIKKIIKTKKLKFKKQTGKPSFFKRRKPLESKLDAYKTTTINKLYDFLRMLDAPDYPKAFIKLNKFKFIFNDIKMNQHKINAKVEIIKNEK
jgi:methionyl-tRNA formyltransferase